MGSYAVNTEIFQGPFDLLLHLVSRQKLDVHALSMTDIIDEYIAHIETMRELDLDIASEFLLLAAQLLELKGASLLPKEQVILDEELEGYNPHEVRDLLAARLIAYKQFKNASQYLETRLRTETYQHPRQAGLEPEFVEVMPDFLEGVTTHLLATMYAELEHRRQVFLLEADHVASAPISLKSYAEKVQEKLRAGVSKTFKELLAKNAQPEEVVVTFLAVLELYKRGLIDMKQTAADADLELYGLSTQEATQRGIATEDFDEY